jgi:Lrp/AsnC family transcriptional regulator, leucine-responsive regulatory protein
MAEPSQRSGRSRAEEAGTVSAKLEGAGTRAASPIPVQLDRSDYRLLEALRGDGRIPISELARRARVSRATAYQRLAKLEDAGVITGYSATVSPRLVGLGVTAVIHISLRQADWRRLVEHARDFPEVENLWITTGSFDALMIVRATDMDTLRDGVLYRVLQLPFVRSTETTFVLDEVVHQPFVLPPAHND